MSRYVRIMLPAICLAAAGAAGENWPGYEGGNLHHNASAVDINPAALKVLWQKRFDNPVSCKTTHPGFYGSRNLVLLDGRLAIVAANGAEGFNNPYAYVTILRAADGAVLNCIATTEATGPRRHQMQYPRANFMEAYDTGIGITVMHWDPATGILFLRNGGDNPSNTAYLPMANAAGYSGRGAQKGVGAYEALLKAHPALADADGNVRADKEIPQDAARTLDGDQWDYGTVKGRFNNQPNSTAFFEVDPDSPVIAAAVEPAHAQAGRFYIASKHNGQYAHVQNYSDIPAPEGKGWQFGKLTFAKWGGLLAGGGRLFLMGPCDDVGGDGFRTSLFQNEKPDQGLRIRALKVAWSDRRPNDGAEGPAANETAELAPLWECQFHSPHAPASPEDAESYLEIDAHHRNKAWLIDGEGVWAAWKPTKAGPVQLIRVTDGQPGGAASTAPAGPAIRTFELPVGQGQRGDDIWPHISLAAVAGRKYVAYYAGNAMYRRFSGTGLAGWSPDTAPPLGPAALAVLDVSAGKAWSAVLNAPDGSGPHPTLPPNEAEGYFDRSQMVVAGTRAFIAWVDVTAPSPPSAILHVLAYDLTAGAGQKPVQKTFDLAIPKAANGRSCLFDLIAADGVLYALITESSTLTSATHTWTAQRVVAIGTGGAGK